MITQRLAWLLLLGAGTTQSGDPQWTRVLPPGSGAWQESWTPGKVPLALKPLAGPGDRLWMIGGRGVWSSSDGLRWERVEGRLPWGDRYGAVPVYFKNRLWVLGGEENGLKRNEVYHSSDGARWLAAARPPWSPRRWHTAIVFRNRLWVLGGTDSEDRNDVWFSSDGESWRRATARAPWPARGRHEALVWRDRLCVIGGGDFSRPRRDFWCSLDGVSWSAVTLQAEWPSRILPGVAVLGGRLWIFGGSAPGRTGDASWMNDVWVSSDGSRWSETRFQELWSPRAAEYSTVWRDRIWVFGGKGIEATGRGGFADDVWTFCVCAPSAPPSFSR